MCLQHLCAVVGGNPVNRIKELRNAAGLTLQQLSDATGGEIKPSRIANWEAGTRQIKVAQAEILARVLNVSPAYLMGLAPDNAIDSGFAALTPAQQELYIIMTQIARLPDEKAKVGKSILQAYLKDT